MEPSLKCNGWNIYFHPLFNSQWTELIDQVKSLACKLNSDEFKKHPQAKMLNALNRAIKEEIPKDPRDKRFKLSGALSEYKRLKNLGLNSRYRLFFKIIDDKKAIVIIWLGFPRKEGDSKDCYERFKKMMNNHSDLTLDKLLDLKLK